jgi:hypothetical protein
MWQVQGNIRAANWIWDGYSPVNVLICSIIYYYPHIRKSEGIACPCSPKLSLTELPLGPTHGIRIVLTGCCGGGGVGEESGERRKISGT